MLITALDPYIQKSVTEYYNSKYVMAPPYVVKVMEAKRPTSDQAYELRLEVEPYIGPHDEVGIDHITMVISPTEIYLMSFEHIKSFSLPPDLQSSSPLPSSGQSTNRTSAVSLIPVRVSGLHHITAVAAGNGDQGGQAGNSAAYALKSDGTILAWGNNMCGQLGNNSTVNSGIPVQVSGLDDVKAIAGGYEAAYALKADGTVWAWGNNASGQLGNNSTVNSRVPVQVSDLTGVTAIAGDHESAYALKNDGTVWAWGNNEVGRLGNDSGAPSLVPGQIHGLTNVKAIAVAGSCYALGADGTVWTWGERPTNQAWYKSTDSHVPVRIPGLSDITAIASGGCSGYAFRSDGTVLAWGWNGEGELGSMDAKETPVQIQGLSGITAVAAFGAGGYAFKQDGTVWAWGGVFGGCYIGNGSDNGSPFPVLVAELAKVKAIASVDYDSYALKSDGTVWAWGTDYTGQLGRGDMN